ncbi:MAG: DNA-binding protein [Christensenellales bacterium]
MRKTVVIILALIICLYPVKAVAVGVKVTGSELIENSKNYDGQEIIFTGEVIGDILNRGDFTWVNITDGNNAIGIWMKSSDAERIGSIGGYSVYGDTIEVQGIFHRACKEHGGDFDIHAARIDILAKGYPVSHATETWKIILAIMLFIGASACMALVFKKKK